MPTRQKKKKKKSQKKNGQNSLVHIKELTKEAEQLKALQLFISGTTREIQSPLKAVFDKTQNLIDCYKSRDFEYIGYKEFKGILKALHNIRDQLKYCFDTSERLMRISKRKAKLDHDHCCVNAVVRESLKMNHHQIEVEDIKISTSFGSKLPHAAISVLDLNDAINNVLTNAIQSIPNSGHIGVKTAFDKQRNQIRIDCEDNGIGIPKEILPYVFDPFFTTKERGLEKSSGLGLSIVNSVIKSYRGHVAVKSSERQGTVIKIYLPVYADGKK